MKQLDDIWHDAPEWADSYGLIGISEFPVYASKGRYQYVNSDGQGFNFGAAGAFSRSDYREIEKRPEPEVTPEEEEAFNMLEARNGECIGGEKLLPPVGWKGKVDHGDFGICDCEVIALHNGKAVCDTEHGYYGASSSCFENATSKDRENWIQQAYQVMLKAYQNKGMMPDDFLSDENTVIYLGELYDAGLAKLPE